MTRREDGFTLSELLVVMAVLALCAAMALPVSRRSLEARELSALTHELAAGLRFARVEAIGKNREAVLKFDFARGYAETGAAAKRIVIPKSIAVKAMTARGDVAAREAAFRFFPDGSATGGEIVLSRDGEAKRIAINWLTGAISIDQGAGP